MARMKLILGAVVILFSLSACGSAAEPAGGMPSSQPGQEASSEAEKAEQGASPQEERETPQEGQETPPQEEEGELSQSGESGPQAAGNFRCQDYAVTIPDNWGDKYIVIYQNCGALDSCIGFYAGLCFEETATGWLFSLAKYHDDSYQEQPCYEVIAEDGDVTYVVIYPTDVQCVGVSEEAQKEYGILSKSMDSVIASFTPVRDL